LSLTQPSLSRQVAALERQAGVGLLDRLATGVVVTAAGRQLLSRPQAIQAQVRAADVEMADLRGATRCCKSRYSRRCRPATD